MGVSSLSCCVSQYVTQTVEVEDPETQKALMEAQAKNAALHEQLGVQRQLLRELETQLHESQRTCTQLRTQVLYMHYAPTTIKPYCVIWMNSFTVLDYFSAYWSNALLTQ